MMMQRRSAVKSLAVTVGGLLSLPAWASGWTPESLGQVSIVPPDQETLLGNIVDVIIPETTTPGAKALKVAQFILRMIQDCYEPEASLLLQQGLDLTESTSQQAYTKSFADCDATQRADVLARLSSSADPVVKSFIDMIKRLTIRGYMNSEYYMVNVQKYTMAPGFYHGCVPVQTVAVGGSR